MNEELNNIIGKVFGLVDAPIGTQVDFPVYYGMDCRADASVKKLNDETWSFGYSALTRSMSNELKIGTNSFKGDIRRLFLGFIKSLTHVEAIRRSRATYNRVLKIIECLEEVIEPLPEDKTKVNLEKWQIPIVFNKNYLR